MTKSKRSKKKIVVKDKLLTHNYDGIQEYDNPMPAWWTIAFWATVAWAVFYIAAINVGWIDTREHDLRTSLDELSRIRAKVLTNRVFPTPGTPSSRA